MWRARGVTEQASLKAPQPVYMKGDDSIKGSFKQVTWVYGLGMKSILKSQVPRNRYCNFVMTRACLCYFCLFFIEEPHCHPSTAAPWHFPSSSCTSPSAICFLLYNLIRNMLQEYEIQALGVSSCHVTAITLFFTLCLYHCQDATERRGQQEAFLCAWELSSTHLALSE